MSASQTRYKLTIEYDGSDYAGWQRQPDRPSIQQALEEAIHGFCQQDTRAQVAGRTDAGVHARGQVVHIDMAPLNKPMQPFEIAKALNAHLRPQPISVLQVEETNEDFHARFSAVNKLYRYRIVNRQGFLALDQNRVWAVRRPLDAQAMAQAAQVLLGQHDFTTFRDSECQAKSPVKTLDRLDVTTRPYDECGGVEIVIETEAQSFLHHQVRNMVGSLALVGEGKWSKDDLHKALLASGPTAPAAGLYLVRVDY